MSKKDAWVRNVAGILEIPKDLVLDEPKVTVLGREEVALENHRGIMDYSMDSVSINFTRGFVRIDGEDLMIKSLYPEEIKIVGRIKKMEFVD